MPSRALISGACSIHPLMAALNSSLLAAYLCCVLINCCRARNGAPYDVMSGGNRRWSTARQDKTRQDKTCPYIGPSTGPGLMALTVARSLSSRAHTRVMASMAALDPP